MYRYQHIVVSVKCRNGWGRRRTSMRERSSYSPCSRQCGRVCFPWNARRLRFSGFHAYSQIDARTTMRQGWPSTYNSDTLKAYKHKLIPASGCTPIWKPSSNQCSKGPPAPILTAFHLALRRVGSLPDFRSRRWRPVMYHKSGSGTRSSRKAEYQQDTTT